MEPRRRLGYGVRCPYVSDVQAQDLDLIILTHQEGVLHCVGVVLAQFELFGELRTGATAAELL
jgi:hypothetical protein